MRKPGRPIFEISAIEKRKLREHKIKLADLYKLGVPELQKLFNVPKIRAMELFALAEFQSLPSVGPRFAQDLIGMGYYSLKDLKGKDGAKLLNNYEKQIGVWTDPCVEDQFRLVVHYANDPSVHKNWWDFTGERKAYREKNGYPSSRPVKAWHTEQQYRRSSNVVAGKEDTKKAVARQLQDSVKYMNKHYGEKLSLTQLAKAATISTHHYLRQFKNVYEVTPIQYLTNIRLKNASRLLKTNKLSVGEISHQCGFENESAFIRVFKSQMTSTPLQYRKGYGS